MAYRQRSLLVMALKERGVCYDTIRLTKKDHGLGRAFVDGRQVGLVYPDSFFERSEPLMDTPKTVHVFFSGYCNAGRRTMLRPWRKVPGAVIQESNTGRTRAAHRWDESYYRALAESKFALCPHHPEWNGDWSALWTYRFIDAALVGSIPVVFRRTPLADAFVDGFEYVWDGEDLPDYDRRVAEHNRRLAEQRWRL